MERDAYLKLAQKFSVCYTKYKIGKLKAGKVLLKDYIDIRVFFEGTEYFPLGYRMNFDNGDPRNVAVLLDLGGNCVVEELIEHVDEVAP